MFSQSQGLPTKLKCDYILICTLILLLLSFDTSDKEQGRPFHLLSSPRESRAGIKEGSPLARPDTLQHVEDMAKKLLVRDEVAAVIRHCQRVSEFLVSNDSLSNISVGAVWLSLVWNLSAYWVWVSSESGEWWMCLSVAQIKDGSGMSFMIRIRCHTFGFVAAVPVLWQTQNLVKVPVLTQNNLVVLMCSSVL